MQILIDIKNLLVGILREVMKVMAIVKIQHHPDENNLPRNKLNNKNVLKKRLLPTIVTMRNGK